MRGGDFVGEIAVRFRLKLIHRNAEHAPAALVRAAAGCLHDSEVATGADREAGFRQHLAHAPRLLVLGIYFAALGATENRNDAF